MRFGKRGGCQPRGTAAIDAPGSDRNALDRALRKLEAARSGRSAMDLAGIVHPRTFVTVCTVDADTPDAMARQAQAYGPVLTLKRGAQAP